MAGNLNANGQGQRVVSLQKGLQTPGNRRLALNKVQWVKEVTVFWAVAQVCGRKEDFGVSGLTGTRTGLCLKMQLVDKRRTDFALNTNIVALQLFAGEVVLRGYA